MTVATAIGRLLLIGVSSFGLATAASWQSHRGYWHGTIFRVQTTDFNILTHTLPTKLSSALQQGAIDELQQTLDSNYGLFGMVVTNCPLASRDCLGQRILYTTNSSQKWRQDLKVESLSKHPYDLLRNPPPLLTEAGFESAHAFDWKKTGRTNSGQIIGRVYYVRGVPPLFRSTYLTWLQTLPSSLLSEHGADKFYALTLILFSFAGLTCWVFVEWMLQRKRGQQRLAQQAQAQLVKEAQNLQYQLQTQLQQQNALLTELESYRQQQAQLIQASTRSISAYENQLAQKEMERQDNTEALAHLQQQLQQTQQQQVQGQAQIEQRSRAITLLKTQIATLQAETQRADESLQRLQTDLQVVRQQANDAHTRIRGLDDSISALTVERNLALKKTQELEQELQTAQTQAARSVALIAALESAEAKMAQLQAHKRQSEAFETYAVEENERLSHRNQVLLQENAQLGEEQSTLQAQIWDLEEQLEWFQNQLCASSSPLRLAPSVLMPEPEAVQLSELSLALVGGHASVRRGVLKVLCEGYGLQHNKYVEVPPTSEHTINQKLLKEKVGNRDLVVVMTRYIGHDLTGMVSTLKANGVLSGEVLLVNGRGKTGVVRSILSHIQKAG